MPPDDASEAGRLIRELRLAPHPEGGWYRELHRSGVRIRRGAAAEERDALTVIWFLLQAGECSCWHRVAAADETWHFSAGSPLSLWRLAPEGGTARRLQLGPLDPLLPQQQPLQLVPAGWWQAARSEGAWTLVHCCVAPGFDFADFCLLRDRPAQERPPGADPALL